MNTEAAKSEFTIIRAPKVRKERVKKERVVRKSQDTKYERVIAFMKRLRVGDHIILAESIPEDKIRQKTANVKFSIKEHLGKRLPRKVFECRSMPAAIHGRTGFDVIVRRVS